MILSDACDILNINIPYSQRELKTKYYKAALKHHPDKNNNDPESTQEFQKILEAYQCLSKQIDDHEHYSSTEDMSYDNIFRKFIYYATGNNSSQMEPIIHMITKKCSAIPTKILESLDKKTLQKLYDYVHIYADVIGISNEWINTIENLIKNKCKKDHVYVLNPTINDLFNDVIYKLEVNEMYYVPLWHEEVEFEKNTNDTLKSSVIIRCVPDVPKHIYLDHHNNINVNISLQISGLLTKEYIDVSIGDKVFKIPTKKICIKPVQTYTFFEEGISKINSDDIYNCTYRADVVIHIALHE